MGGCGGIGGKSADWERGRGLGGGFGLVLMFDFERERDRERKKLYSYIPIERFEGNKRIGPRSRVRREEKGNNAKTYPVLRFPLCRPIIVGVGVVTEGIRQHRITTTVLALQEGALLRIANC